MTDPRKDVSFKRAAKSGPAKKPMRPEQASELRDLCRKTDNIDTYREDISEAEACTLIDRLREKATSK